VNQDLVAQIADPTRINEGHRLRIKRRSHWSAQKRLTGTRLFRPVLRRIQPRVYRARGKMGGAGAWGFQPEPVSNRRPGSRRHRSKMILMQFPGELKSVAASVQPSAIHNVWRMRRRISPAEIAALASLFPTMAFEPIGAAWPNHPGHNVDILVIGLSAASSPDLEKPSFSANSPPRLHVLVALRAMPTWSVARALTPRRRG